MENQLVSIITPCYNMECYIGRFLDSVLEQTYRSLELIIIDDVSTDNSDKIIKSYIPLLSEKSIQFKYIRKEKNEGLAAAINSGLAVFTGEFLIWPDSDDFMSPILIEKMVAFLVEHEDYGLVRTNVKFLKEENGILRWKTNYFPSNLQERFNEELFDITIFERRGVSFVPGSYMIRTDIFEKANQSKSIYPCRRGQNWQILLPVMYISKCGYIDEPLHNYVVRENSMSRTDFSIEDSIYRCNEHEDILLNTIQSIKCIDVVRYNELIKNKYHLRRFKISCRYGNKKYIDEYFKRCKDRGLLNKKHYLLYYSLRIIPFALHSIMRQLFAKIY